MNNDDTNLFLNAYFSTKPNILIIFFVFSRF